MCRDVCLSVCINQHDFRHPWGHVRAQAWVGSWPSACLVVLQSLLCGMHTCRPPWLAHEQSNFLGVQLPPSLGFAHAVRRMSPVGPAAHNFSIRTM